MLDGFYLNPLTGRVGTLYVGAEGDHVQLRMAGSEQAAFQPGVYHLQAGWPAELRGIDPLAQHKQAG